MGAPNIRQFGESAVGPLGLRVRALWKANGWKLSDDEFSNWQKHLHVAGHTYSDLYKAVFDYVHRGGHYKPQFGDLKQLLQLYKHKRIGTKKKPTAQDRDTTPDGPTPTERMKQIHKEGPLTREKKSELYDLLRDRNNRCKSV